MINYHYYFDCYRGPPPPYTIIQEPPEGHPDFLVAEMHLPKVVRLYETFIKAGFIIRDFMSV